MKRLLPPLIVLGVLVWVVVRVAALPQRERTRAHLEAALADLRPSEASRERLVREVAEYLADYGDRPEDRWFVARFYLKLGEVRRAVDAVWDDPRLAEAEGTQRRFAALVLRVQAFRDDLHLELPLPGAPFVTLILAENGDEEALALLDRMARDGGPGDAVPLYMGATMRARREVRERVAAAFRQRGGVPFRQAAALMALEGGEYPQREADLAAVTAVLDGPWRRERNPMWAACCLAAGRTGSPSAIALLEDLAARLAVSPDERDRMDGALVACGLLAAGRWDAESALRPYVLAEPAEPYLTGWYVTALLARRAAGDLRAQDRLLDLWRGPGARRLTGLRARIATEWFLRDDLPDAEIPVERLLQDLEAPDASGAERAVALSFRLRRGEPGARERLVEFVASQRYGPDGMADAGLVDANVTSPLLTACRALHLYEP